MAPRTFVIPSYSDEQGRVVPDREEVNDLAGDLIGSILRLGGIVSIAAHREEVTPGQYETTAVIVTHDKHSPATRLPKEEAESAGV